MTRFLDELRNHPAAIVLPACKGNSVTRVIISKLTCQTTLNQKTGCCRSTCHRFLQCCPCARSYNKWRCPKAEALPDIGLHAQPRAFSGPASEAVPRRGRDLQKELIRVWLPRKGGNSVLMAESPVLLPAVDVHLAIQIPHHQPWPTCGDGAGSLPPCLKISISSSGTKPSSS